MFYKKKLGYFGIFQEPVRSFLFTPLKLILQFTVTRISMTFTTPPR